MVKKERVEVKGRRKKKKEENGRKREKESMKKRIKRKEKSRKAKINSICEKDLYIFRNSYSW